MLQPVIQLDQFPFSADEGVVLGVQSLQSAPEFGVLRPLAFQIVQRLKLVFKFCATITRTQRDTVQSAV